ncbi:MAG: hypothetical protein JXB42_11225 [Deltaproteobacteria bacterium]|nr:hypothetical protein [Deltaproteobacteria bacterium]
MNRKFRRDYDRLFRKDPATANLLLLLCELANERGEVQVTDEELCLLMNARFEDPRAYQLPGGPKR